MAEPASILTSDEVGPCGSPTCEAGWRRVTEQYVDRYAPPWPDPPPLGSTPEVDAAYEREVQRIAALRAGIANSWYPCRECKPRLFFRWVGGHWNSDHVAEACPQCQEGLPHHHRRRPADTPTSAADMAKTAAQVAAEQAAARQQERDSGEF